jgi:hypothetical protein
MMKQDGLSNRIHRYFPVGTISRVPSIEGGPGIERSSVLSWSNPGVSIDNESDQAS